MIGRALRHETTIATVGTGPLPPNVPRLPEPNSLAVDGMTSPAGFALKADALPILTETRLAQGESFVIFVSCLLSHSRKSLSSQKSKAITGLDRSTMSAMGSSLLAMIECPDSCS